MNIIYIMNVIIIVLLIVNFVYQVVYSITRKDVTDLYMENKLVLSKDHYVEHRLINGVIKIVMVDSLGGNEYLISNIYEKGFSLYFITEGHSFRYSSIFHRIKIC